MRLAALFIFLFISANIFAQDRDIVQPQSLYKMLKVKEQIRTFKDMGSNSTITNYYDENGRLIKFILTDIETGKRHRILSTYQYDSTGKLDKEKTVYDSDTANIETTQFHYDSSKRRVRSFTQNKNGQVKSSRSISYNPHVEKQLIFDEFGNTTRGETVWLQTPIATKKSIGYQITEGKKQTWDYHYKNTFDTKGRIIKRTDNNNKTTIYTYNKQGLLVQKTSVTKINKSTSTAVEIFSYKFYE